MNHIQEQFISRTSEQESEEILVQTIKERMTNRLHEVREEEGKGGWYSPKTVSTEDLLVQLKNNIEDEDWLDVVIIASMLNIREDLWWT